MNNIIFLLGNTNTYNNLVYNNLNDCIDASSIFNNTINWKIPEALKIINHASNNERIDAYSPFFYYEGGQFYKHKVATDYTKNAVYGSVTVVHTNYGRANCMYRPCITIHE